jgi:hypothetical protein
MNRDELIRRVLEVIALELEFNGSAKALAHSIQRVLDAEVWEE